MQIFLDAARQKDFQNLVNQFYDMHDVHGFAWGIDWAYVSLVKGQDPGRPIDEAIAKNLIPGGWPEHCRARGFTSTLSPLHVVIYVDQDANGFRNLNNVPTFIPAGHEVIVEQRGRLEAASDYNTHRPLVGGICVGNQSKLYSGTLGGFVKESGTHDPEILSCQHVLHDPRSTEILQKSVDHGGVSPTDCVAKVSHSIPFVAHTGFGYSSKYNKVDACLAKVDTTASAVTANIRHIVTFPQNTTAVNHIMLGDLVEFVGKESDHRDGFIFRFISRQKVNIDGTIYNFGDFFEMKTPRPISLAKKGDSGAWVLRGVTAKSSEFCGLLFAIDPSAPAHAYCCFAEYVMDEINHVSRSVYDLF